MLTLSYDKNCYRLGYSSKFYNRFIKLLKDDIITISIFFDLQIFDSITKEDHNIPLNYIITENNMYIGNFNAYNWSEK